jgi:hypothetical protein
LELRIINYDFPKVKAFIKHLFKPLLNQKWILLKYYRRQHDVGGQQVYWAEIGPKVLVAQWAGPAWPKVPKSTKSPQTTFASAC